jgi:hypothetical protein
VIDAQPVLDNTLNKDITRGTIPQKDNKAPNQSTTPKITSISIDNNTGPEKNEKPSDDKHNHGCGKTIEEKTLEVNKWMVAIAFLQLIVFGLQGIFLYKTIRSSDKTAKSMENSERAWMCAEFDGAVSRMLVQSQKYTFTISNYGKTVAFVKNINHGIEYNSIIQKKWLPLDATVLDGGVSRTYSVTKELTKEDYVKISGNKFSLIAYCQIDYTDIFQAIRRTELRWDFQDRGNEGRRFFLVEEKYT